MLEIDDLTAGYGEAVVLEDISLRLDEAEGLAVLGRNGVGKTTLILALMGHASIAGGTIRWRGADISRSAAHDRAALGIGWVPQERGFQRLEETGRRILVSARDIGHPRLNRRPAGRGPCARPP